MPQLRLSFLGTFQVHLDDKLLPSFRSTNMQCLLAYLALENGQEHPRDQIASIFWPEESQSVARRNLSQTLYLLRKQVDPDGSAPPHLLVNRRTLRFNPDSDFTLDVSDFLTALEQDRPDEALPLYRGEFLDGIFSESVPFEEWLLHTRDRLSRTALGAFSQVARAAEGSGELKTALSAVQRQLEMMPWREEAHLHLMQLLLQQGEREAALAQYEICRRLLAEEFDAEPGAEITALHDTIRSGGAVKNQSDQPLRDWGSAPHAPELFGRDGELARLRAWIVGEGCRVVGVLGMGGQGKTVLTARLMYEIADHFDGVIWRSLINAPSLDDLLGSWLRALSNQRLVDMPDTTEGRFELLFQFLKSGRYLLALDNMESILREGEWAGSYANDFAGYGELLRRFAGSDHGGTLLITSRERPHGLERLERDTPTVRWLELEGLDAVSGEAVLTSLGLELARGGGTDLVARYSGNPLALKLVAEVVQDLFLGDVDAYLAHETPLFDDIRDVLEQQFARLSRLEREIIFWLAIERKPLSLPHLKADLLVPESHGDLLSAVRSLQRRSLLEQIHHQFRLQNVVMEFATNQIIEATCREIESGEEDRLRRIALLKSQTQDYIRESQRRLILEPIANRLRARLGVPRLEDGIRTLLARLRKEAPRTPGYTAGNLLNLLLHIGSDLSGFDFSQLAVWQAHLGDRELTGANFRESDLTGSVFSDTFAYIPSLAWHPAGDLIAAGTMAGEVRLWRSADQQPAGIYPGQRGPVYAVAFSPDGKQILSGGEDGTVRILDLESGRWLHTLEAHDGAVWDVAIDPGSHWAAASYEGGHVVLWDRRSGERGSTFSTDAWCRTVAYHPTQRLLAAGDDDGSVYLWNPDSENEIQRLEGGCGGIWSIAFSPDGRYLAAGGLDGAIALWETRQWKQVGRLSVPGAWMRSIVFHPQGHTLISGDSDHSVRIWEVPSGQLQRVLSRHTARVWAVAVDPQGQALASSGPDQTIRLWDLPSGRIHRTLAGRTGRIWSLDVSPDNSTVASAGEDTTVHLWDLHDLRLKRTLREHTNWLFAVAYDSRGERIVSGGGDLIARVWDLEQGRSLHILREHHNRVCALAFSPDGRTIASGGEDGKLCFWDAASGRLLWVQQTAWIFAVAFHPTLPWLASADAEGLISFWDTEGGKRLSALSGHEGHVFSIRFSASGSHLLSGSQDRSVRLWCVESGRVLGSYQTRSRWVRSVALDPQDQTIAAADGAHIRLWRWGESEAIYNLSGHDGMVTSITFDRCGRRLLSGGFDGSIRVWDVASGEAEAILRPPQPYSQMDITGAVGLSEAQRTALHLLGAVG